MAKSKASQSQAKPRAKKAAVKGKSCREVPSPKISSSDSTPVRSLPKVASAAETSATEKEPRELAAKGKRQKRDADKESERKDEPKAKFVSLKLPPSTARPSAGGKDRVAPLEQAKTSTAVHAQQMERSEARKSAASLATIDGREKDAGNVLENKGTSDGKLASKVGQASDTLSKAVTAAVGTQSGATKSKRSTVEVTLEEERNMDAQGGKRGRPGRDEIVSRKGSETLEGREDEQRRPKNVKVAPNEEREKLQAAKSMESAEDGATKSGRSEEVNVTSNGDLVTVEATQSGPRKRGRPKKVRVAPGEGLGKVENVKTDEGGEVQVFGHEMIEPSSCRDPSEKVLEGETDVASKREEEPSEGSKTPNGNKDGLSGQTTQPPQPEEAQGSTPTKMSSTAKGQPKLLHITE
ncbi:hypothetical protein KFL_000260420 [Klebsormidium nitens]|uniref:Uncharacterized protein n=1 Tax=Klebsormidium nitens TaxID=105231 RepID=A0A1Y1HRM3_KLENI|nr:hypothetical protein KFL_000260420 [Klebsormidium nitens]|eukprot:GAQ79226.1 hypothetical protein KFL_000260420 [Klebsormidium nitens]